MPRTGPGCAAVRRAQGDEVAHTVSPVQLLNVVPPDQPALRVADQIDSLARMIASQLLDPLGQDAGHLLDRPRVEPAEEPAEIDTMSAVSRPPQSNGEAAEGAWCSEEAVQEQDRSPPAWQRTKPRWREGRCRHPSVQHGWRLTKQPPCLPGFAAGVAVAAYGTFFAMPWRMLPIPILIGILAHALRWAAISLAGASVATGALVACLVVGTLTTPIADRLRLPFAAFAFASVVSLIPGVFLFRMAGGLVGLVALGRRASPDLLFGVIADGATAMLVILAVTFGLILPKMGIEHFYPGVAKPIRQDPG